MTTSDIISRKIIIIQLFGRPIDWGDFGKKKKRDILNRKSRRSSARIIVVVSQNTEKYEYLVRYDRVIMISISSLVFEHFRMLARVIVTGDSRNYTKKASERQMFCDSRERLKKNRVVKSDDLFFRIFRVPSLCCTNNADYGA